MYDDWTNDELREELADRDLSTGGNKDELVARLEADDEGPEAEAAPAAAVTADTPEVVEKGPENEPDDNGLVGVSPEMRHKPASIHFSANPEGDAETEES